MLLFWWNIQLWDRDINFSDILLHEKLYKKRNENILVYDILYKTSIGVETVRIKFNKIEGFIKIHDKIRYLVLKGSYRDKSNTE